MDRMSIVNKDGKVTYITQGCFSIAIEETDDGYLTATLLDGPAYIKAQGHTSNEAVDNLFTAFSIWQETNAIEQNKEM